MTIRLTAWELVGIMDGEKLVAIGARKPDGGVIDVTEDLKDIDTQHTQFFAALEKAHEKQALE